MQPGESLSFEQLITRSEEIAQQTGRNDLRARIFATEFLASWYGANGLHRKAETLLTRTLDSLPEESARLGAGLRCARARVWGSLGRGDAGIAVAESEIALNESDAAVKSHCQLVRSVLAAQSGDANATLEFAQAALRNYEAAGVESVYGRTDILKMIGAAHGLRDEFAAAHAHYREALRLFAETGRERSRPAANVHDDWSSAWMNAGNPRRAIEEIDIGWEITRALAPGAQISDSRLLRHARLLVQLGRLDEAARELAVGRDLGLTRGNLASVAGVVMTEAEVAMLRGDFAAAGGILDEAAARLRALALPPHHVLQTRHTMARATLLAAQGNPAEAVPLLTQSIEDYQAQACCRAHIALALALRAELAVRDGDLSRAAQDAAQARVHAPALESESFSRFTGRAWYVSGLVHEAQGKQREARDAFATAAVQFAGAVGDTHPDTLLARAGIERAARLVN
jgi:tetratricopeptide (TPR) repeat protein